MKMKDRDLSLRYGTCKARAGKARCKRQKSVASGGGEKDGGKNFGEEECGIWRNKLGRKKAGSSNQTNIILCIDQTNITARH